MTSSSTSGPSTARSSPSRSSVVWPGSERLAELGHCAIGARHRAVARRAGDPRADPAQPLLGDLHRIEGRVAEVQREAAGLADRVLGLDLGAVLLDQELRAVLTAGLLV